MSVELNVAVAEAVFGAVWREIPVWDANSITDRLSIPSGAVAHRYGDGQVCRFSDYLDFSGNMTDAWLIVEATKAKRLRMWVGINDFNENEYAAQIWTFDPEHSTPIVERCDPNAPVAICLAALEALGVPFEQKVNHER